MSNGPGGMPPRTRVLAGLAILLLGGSLLGGCVTISSRANARDTVSLSLDVPLGTPARVESFNGGITVSPASGSSITAEVVRRGEGADDAEAQSHRDGIAVTLELVDGVALLRAVYTPAPESVPGGTGAAVTLRVPAQTGLRLETSNGPIGVRDVWGGLEAHTSNGPVSLTDMVGAVSVETSNGPVNVEAGEAVTLTVDTSNAAVTFEGELAPGAHGLKTSNGRVEMTLPPDAAFTVDASTSAGEVTSEFAMEGTAEGSAMRGTTGAPEDAAATVVTIRTSNAPIVLKQG